MSNLTVYARNRPQVYLKDPDIEQVSMQVNLLDGLELLSMQLVTLQGYLTIFASQAGRMHVHFINGVQDRYLVDRDEPETPLLAFRLANGGVDDWSLRETVSREAAL